MDNITENNKLIAEFMGFKLQDNPNERWFNQWFVKDTSNKPYQNRIEILHFDTDWNWLMSVVEKIESLENNLKNETREEFIQFQKVLSLPIYNKIEVAYNACIEFIKWYNEQNKINESL